MVLIIYLFKEEQFFNSRQRTKNISKHMNRLQLPKNRKYAPERVGSSGDDKELLEGKLVSGVLSSIDHVEAWDGKSVRAGVASDVGVVFPERNSSGSGSSLGSSNGNCFSQSIKFC